MDDHLRANEGRFAVSTGLRRCRRSSNDRFATHTAGSTRLSVRFSKVRRSGPGRKPTVSTGTCTLLKTVVRVLPPPALRDPDPPAWIMYSQPRLCDLFKEIMAGLLQRPGSGPVRIRNDLDASHFSHLEAQEVG